MGPRTSVRMQAKARSLRVGDRGFEPLTSTV